jgi:hypothetical protein
MPNESTGDWKLAFEVEEYRQVLQERHFVMTRYMQAIGLYLALSGFALRELIGAESIWSLLLLGGTFTGLNVLAVYAAGQFRNMAHSAMVREEFFAKTFDLQKTHELFWGYRLGIWLVAITQVSVGSAVLLKLAFPLVLRANASFSLLK